MGPPRLYGGLWQAYLESPVHTRRFAPRPFLGLCTGRIVGDDPLTPDQLKQLMDDLGFTTSDVAILMGVTRRTPQLWLSGVNPVPQSAAILLEAIKEGLVTIEWLEGKIILAMQIA